jgi:hypothetical protein
MSRIHAIPTKYAGVRFRSRLEARWARFFDLVRWRWEYEPLDMDGYIPDFVLLFPRPVLVEVKPTFGVNELAKYTGKIEGSGWPGEALLVGATIGEDNDMDGPRGPRLGLLAEHSSADPGWNWGPAAGFRCTECDALTFCHAFMCWRSRVCDHYDGDGYIGSDDGAIRQAWREASNAVQWNPSTDEYPDWDEVLP